MAEGLTVGQRVKLWSRYYSTMDATITKVGRVWCEVTPDGRSTPVRIHMQRRSENNGYSDRYHLYTLDEWAERERSAEASAFLRAQGISLERNSPWSATGLAYVIREARAHNIGALMDGVPQ